MIGFSRVTIAVLISAFLRRTASFAVIPSTHLWAKTRATFARISMDCCRSYAITGIIVQRSRFEWEFATAIVASFPITSIATILTASQITGFTLPGVTE